MKFHRHRLVRLHQLGHDAPSYEGVLVGRPNGFYRLVNASLIEAPGRTTALEGETWVPRERVVLMQVLNG